VINDVTACHNRGEAWLNIGRYEHGLGQDGRAAFRAAIEEFAQEIALDPRSPSARNGRGHALRHLGEADQRAGSDPSESFRRSMEDFNAALESQPGHGKSLAGRAQLNAAMGQFREAIADYEEVLKAEPGNVVALNNLADTLKEFGEQEDRRGADPRELYARAIRNVEAALEIRPDLTPAHNTRGLTFRALGKTELRMRLDFEASFRQAEASLSRSLEMNPRQYRILNNRAMTRFDLARLKEPDRGALLSGALTDMDRSIELGPPLWTSHANRGLILAELERWPEAIAADEEALKINPGAPGVREHLERMKRELEF
jgi:tetratricopeptide (TPR) repeat protein